MATDLPCDGEGICMLCKKKSPVEETIVCSTCATPWHVPCLSKPLDLLPSLSSWECPDCAAPARENSSGKPARAGGGSDLVAAIQAIERIEGLTEQEKAKRRQELLSNGVCGLDEDAGGKDRGRGGDHEVLDLLDEKFKCAMCMQLPERPVTTPCGHNFCLKCFQRWVGQSKQTCAKCRARIPPSMASQPRINSALVFAIRTARAAKSASSNGSSQVYHYVRNEDRPEEAYTTERAKRAGKANACSGQIFVTIPPDHFGPITKDYDPKYGEGVYVGRTWDDRLECRQWGAHFPHVAGIAGQSGYGAQSVALSGGYKDDEDHGEWFLYTGSGGRDLSGNKRTNKEQSFDQKFEKLNQALKVSCQKGYPVRVVRSHKEKRSSYAPEKGVRYDGVYRIEMCWRKVGVQGFRVCRYLFVRCDNDPAPWTSDTQGDRPRPLPKVAELKGATDVWKRTGKAAWDYDEKDGWKWFTPPPASQKSVVSLDADGRKRVQRASKTSRLSVRDKMLKEFSCLLCKKIMAHPLTTPCGHNFCKSCLLGSYEELSALRERSSGGRSLRAQKITRKCPSCPNDISEFLQAPQVNREMMDLIESLQRKEEEESVENEEAKESVMEGEPESDLTNSEEEIEKNEKVQTATPLKRKRLVPRRPWIRRSRSNAKAAGSMAEDDDDDHDDNLEDQEEPEKSTPKTVPARRVTRSSCSSMSK
ncbi:E3 ubiquitin-protein ligase ORTHRUS 2-like [Wolffia australiana]